MTDLADLVANKQRNIANPYRPGEKVDVWWYDSYRVMDGMITEHWDCAHE